MNVCAKNVNIHVVKEIFGYFLVQAFDDGRHAIDRGMFVNVPTARREMGRYPYTFQHHSALWSVRSTDRVLAANLCFKREGPMLPDMSIVVGDHMPKEERIYEHCRSNAWQTSKRARGASVSTRTAVGFIDEARGAYLRALP